MRRRSVGFSRGFAVAYQIVSIISPHDAKVLCSATVDLITRLQRPFLWRVTVVGQPPHAHRRIYDIPAPSEDAAAYAGIDRFVEEFSRPISVLEVIH